MPANIVKTPADEKKWEKAKRMYEHAKENGFKGDKWAFVMKKFQEMKSGEIKSFYDGKKLIASFLLHEAKNLLKR